MCVATPQYPLALVLALLVGCVAGPPDPPPEPTPDPGSWLEQPPPGCADPTSGFVRLEQVTGERGLDPLPVAGPSTIAAGTTIVAMDGDADGDIDVFFPRAMGSIQAFENDGAGHFTAVEQPEVGLGGSGLAGAITLVDLDGDRLPDLVAEDRGGISVARNQGGLVFGPSRVLFPAGSGPVVVTLVVGDVDGDGDFDVLLPRNSAPGLPPSDPEAGTTDLLFLGDGDLLGEGELSAPIQFETASGRGMSLVASITDFDRDGDKDLFLISDLGHGGAPPSALFVNDGGPPGGWVDRAPELGADLQISGMGVDAIDLNQDGRLDYCISDVGPPKCLLSFEGGFIEAAASLGLLPPALPNGRVFSGWSTDFVDLDNDGWEDVAMAAAPPGGPDLFNEFPVEPDALWQGSEDGFTERAAELGFDDEAYHWGLVSADLDGDGWPELMVQGKDGSFELWWNRCGDEGWLDVELLGPPENTFGFGAIVEVDVGERTRLREVQGLRSQGQGPGRLHFGLGERDSVEAIRVFWPDGELSHAASVPGRRRVGLAHPRAVIPPTW